MFLDTPHFTLTHVEANGIRLQVATAGDGSPILLLHGWPHTWFLWHKVMPELARQHRVIAPNMRGIGGSRLSVTEAAAKRKVEHRHECRETLSLLKNPSLDVSGQPTSIELRY